jgi:drug/metabolite transporter (DMT)-like permease
MFTLLRWTRWLGPASRISPETNRRLWVRGGLGLAAYVALFNLALRFTAASHVALYLAASPVWVLLWVGRTDASVPDRLKCGGAALLALSGVAVLLWPTLHKSTGSLTGELLGLAASVLWTHYGRQCRALGGADAALISLSGAEIAAHTMWRAGILLLPFALLEASRQPPHWSPMLLATQCYCVIAGGIVAFALWNHALRHWQTSEVYLFNNLIPLRTASWAHFCLRETISPTFWPAMVLIVAGVLASQAEWRRLLGINWLPEE